MSTMTVSKWMACLMYYVYKGLRIIRTEAVDHSDLFLT